MENYSEVTFLILAAYGDLGRLQYLYFTCLLLLYLTIIITNIILISLIFVDRSLHEPMYMFLCNLFLNELYGSTAFYSVLLLHILSDTHEISRVYCNLQIFGLYTYATTEIHNLAVMAYDRYLSICHPLHYNSRMSSCKVCSFILFTWLFSFIRCSFTVYLQSRLPLCGNVLHKLNCANYLVVRLSCINTTINNIYGFFSAFLSLLFPLIPILYSYSNILRICYNSPKEAQIKALNTCVPQVISLLNFSISCFIAIVQNRFDMTHVPLVIRNAFTIYIFSCSQLLNPIMFGVKLTKIRDAFKKGLELIISVPSCKRSLRSRH